MQTIIKTLTSNRFKSFYWRTGMMTLAYFVSVFTENLGLLELPIWAVTVIGLVLGEVSKFINENLKKS